MGSRAFPTVAAATAILYIGFATGWLFVAAEVWRVTADAAPFWLRVMVMLALAREVMFWTAAANRESRPVLAWREATTGAGGAP